MKIFKKILFLFLATFMAANIFAQEAAQDVPMADEMRANGKIYVVVSVMSLIFIGIIIYMISIDKKIKKLEKDLNSK